jgi:hypothetical protein
MKAPQQSSAPASGGTLLLAALLCAVAPVILEMIGDGGPSHLGDPETGYAMVFTGFVLWPLALMLVLIGLKRILANAFAKPASAQTTPAPAPEQIQNVTMTDAWAQPQSGATKETEE